MEKDNRPQYSNLKMLEGKRNNSPLLPHSIFLLETQHRSVEEGEVFLSPSVHLPVMVYPLAASSPAMYSPSLLLCEQPHVFTYTDWVPGMKLSAVGRSGAGTFLRRVRGNTLTR